ncbi:hypothetical protein Pla52o_20130 [Novipirellula galeiformis]|uniref:Uncharacterized protein n=1 Tax=Novipirellula galeiformis TaxID=2528004 RepID=A0A5C6CHF4_9BACT|nr:hypothetical protein Pla52o_20130 [Novipirellula galeiformis]
MDRNEGFGHPTSPVVLVWCPPHTHAHSPVLTRPCTEHFASLTKKISCPRILTILTTLTPAILSQVPLLLFLCNSVTAAWKSETIAPR